MQFFGQTEMHNSHALHSSRGNFNSETSQRYSWTLIFPATAAWAAVARAIISSTSG